MQTAATPFNELLDEFRALGGIAENVRRGVGQYGPGIFPVDAARPVRLHATENLVFPTEDLEVRDGRLAIRRTSSAGTAERRLFEAVHEHFGWSTGTFDELWTSQVRWSRLPPAIVASLKCMGAINDPDYRFAETSVHVCLYQFVKSRNVAYKGRACIMPFVDLTNHSSGAPPFVLENGIGVRGTFPGEVFVRYNVADSWSNTLTYGFADDSPFAYSLSLVVELFGTQRLSILRNIATHADDDGIRFPQKRIDGNTIELSHLMLGNARQPDLPRAVFRKLMRDHVTERQADDVFESVVRFNHTKFLDELRVLRKHDAPLVAVLEDAAINQLDALSACVGARAL